MATKRPKGQEDTGALQFYQPGMTQAKRPALVSLAQDGAIDLKRLLPPDQADLYSRGEAVQNNRDRLANGEARMREVAYVPGRHIDLKRSLHDKLEVTLARDALMLAAKQTKKRSVWGDEDYTADTDLFVALVHSGFLPAAVMDPGFAWSELVKEARAVLEVHKSRASYRSVTRNGVTSRAWPSECCGCSFRIVRAWLVSSGAPQDIEVELDRPPEDTHIEPSKPFFLLSQQDQRISTRQLTHGGDRRRRCGSEVATIVYSLANEPWLKYGYACIADCGFTGQQYTASRLSREVLYLETEGERYELCLLPEGHKRPGRDGPRFRFGRCKDVLPDESLRAVGTPMPAAMVEPLFPSMSWECLLWGENSLQIEADDSTGARCTRTFLLVRMHWMKASHTRPSSEA